MTTLAWGQPTRETATYRRLKTALDAIPAIDTHDHLWPFDRLPGHVETERGQGMNLASLWRNSYFTGVHPLTPWTPGMSFTVWWDKAKHDFDDARATSVYRYQLPAFADLYNVDFDRITDAQARDLDERIFAHYQDQSWLYHVITERANIELMFNDPYWGRLEFKTRLPVRRPGLQRHDARLTASTPPSSSRPATIPTASPRRKGSRSSRSTTIWSCSTRLFQKAKAAGAVCLKTTLAYQRTLRFENVPKDRAARAFGRPRSELTPPEIKDFEDFIMWRLVELSAGTTCRSRSTPATGGSRDRTR